MRGSKFSFKNQEKQSSSFLNGLASIFQIKKRKGWGWGTKRKDKGKGRGEEEKLTS